MTTRILDVRVRLPMAKLASLAPRHLYSEIEPDAEAAAPPGTIRGRTEWAVDGTPALSFAWDFSYEDATGSLFGHWDALRTNVVITDVDGNELPGTGSRDFVAQWVTDAGWERAVATSLGFALGGKSAH